MKFLKFVKHYMKMKKVMNDLEYRKAVVEINVKKLETKLEKYHGTLSAYSRKKLEFQKGKLEGYTNSLLVIEKFMDTGKLPEVIEIEIDENNLAG